MNRREFTKSCAALPLIGVIPTSKPVNRYCYEHMFIDLFDYISFGSDCDVEFPLDMLTPGQEIHRAMDHHGKISNGDYINVPMDLSYYDTYLEDYAKKIVLKCGRNDATALNKVFSSSEYNIEYVQGQYSVAYHKDIFVLCERENKCGLACLDMNKVFVWRKN